jgi:hypothetical protein
MGRIKNWDFEETFEKRWKEHINLLKDKFNERHTSRIARFMLKPDYYDENSSEHKLMKSIAELFFSMGTYEELKRINKMLDWKND